MTPRPDNNSPTPFRYCLICGAGWFEYLACNNDCRFTGVVPHNELEAKKLKAAYVAGLQNEAAREREATARANCEGRFAGQRSLKIEPPDGSKIWFDITQQIRQSVEPVTASSWGNNIGEWK